MPDKVGSKRFPLVLIKPSHYDDDGYVIQWLRSAIPSNTLAVLNGLALDCQERHVLGEDVDIEISSIDETNTRVRPERYCARTARRRKRPGGAGGRAVEPVSARHGYRAPFARGRACTVCIGGFHVSGMLAMLPDIAAGAARRRWTWAFLSSRARPKGASRGACATRGTAR